MPVFVDALIGDTMSLSTEEFGAYCLILFATWRNNGTSLRDDDRRMARICRMTGKRWRERIRPALEPFFDLSGGMWRQGRLEKEWNFVAKKVEQTRSAGIASYKAKQLKKKETHTADVDVAPEGGDSESRYSKSDFLIAKKVEQTAPSLARDVDASALKNKETDTTDVASPLQRTGQQPTPTPTEEENPTADALGFSARKRAGGDAPNRSQSSPKPGAKNGRRKAKKPIEPDWQPDTEDREYAYGRGYGDEWIDRESEGFRDYHLKNASEYADWHAAWRTWVQNAAKFAGGGGSGHRPGGNGQAHGGIAAALRRVRVAAQIPGPD